MFDFFFYKQDCLENRNIKYVKPITPKGIA